MQLSSCQRYSRTFQAAPKGKHQLRDVQRTFPLSYRDHALEKPLLKKMVEGQLWNQHSRP